MPPIRLDTAPHDIRASLDTLSAMARMAADTHAVVHVVVPRAPWVLSHARAMADQTHVRISADLQASTLRVRFDGTA
jgi:hypothetical protein